MIVRRIARPMLASIFIAGGIDALRNPAPKAAAAQTGLDQMIGVAPDSVTDRLPSNPETLVQINAAVQVGAGALLAIGKWPRISALALAGTVVPTTVAGHDFWNYDDPAERAQHRTQFLKNVGLLGGLLLASVDTEGKPSLGWRGRRAARHAQEAVVAALPGSTSDHATGDALHTVSERVKSLTEEASQQGSTLLEKAKERAPELAEVARDRGTEILEVARERGPELAAVARDRGTELLDAAKEHAPELTDTAKERSTELLERARNRAPEYAEVARRRGSKWWETTLDRGTELAHLAEERSSELNAKALENAQQARARAEKAGKKAAKAEKALEKKLR
ncbi:DoxX family membrane protein [Rhodococcus artemisiae]|uniref:DoxX family membrane protein n=1 Tax=Rhodococcus artemisiae TaxID=714159 RepID=A0ABU7LER3_9NOCA|nr:DoxX family membrane protein [Rhodococcus artemisiae]MEE2060045.1 DoxX family membrane protein [Rhodococcus artemisiae]